VVVVEAEAEEGGAGARVEAALLAGFDERERVVAGRARVVCRECELGEVLEAVEDALEDLVGRCHG